MNTNRKNIIITVIVTLVVGLLLGWLIFHNPEPVAESHEGHELEASEDATIWTCSMHPQVRQPEPGDCPICGMELIPLEEGHEETSPMAISMSPTAMQLANIQTAVVGKMTPVKSVRLDGKIDADERLISTQSSHIPGRIERLNVNFEGQFVNRGTPVAYVYSPDLVTAQEELFEAMKIKESQPELFNAAKEKLKNWKLTDAQINQIIESKEVKEVFPILADVSGYVTEKRVNTGDYIKRGEAIFEIANLSRVWVLFDVYESDIPWVEEGDEVTFTVASLPGKEFKADITYLDPVINPKTRVAKARVEVKNKDLLLKPEMFVSGTVEASLPAGENAVVVPKSAVMWTGERSVVYIKTINAEGVSFMMREVTLGPALGESYIIEDGLEEGEEIAVHGTFSIDAAAQLAGKPSMMNPEGGKSMTGHNHAGMSGSEMSAMENDQMKSQSFEVDPNFKAQLTDLLRQYLDLKNALVESDASKAAKAAREVNDKLEKVDMELLKGDAHMKWMDQLDVLAKTVVKMSESDDIEEIRHQFALFSDAFYHALKSFGIQEDTAYYQFCPMAENDKGAFWISETDEIKNPYFGEAMLGCGENRDTIAAK